VRYIELFAGCGGLSLGLKSVGFELTFANELSPMAAESYAYNFLNEDLRAIDSLSHQKTLWLSSAFNRSQLLNRLRENPNDFPKLGSGCTDIDPQGTNIDGSLIVGSIVELNNWLTDNPKALKRIKNSFGRGPIDLISGGPPCQSFSMAGLREKDNHKNSLPWEFAKLVSAVRPRITLLENVSGILRPFTGKDGGKYYAWFELAKAFSQIGYIPLCLHINAKFVKVPQNRPRFILLGFREDVLNSLWPTLNEQELELFGEPRRFYLSAKGGADVGLESLNYRDVARDSDWQLFAKSFLRPLVASKKLVSVKAAIDDLKSGSRKGVNRYSKELDHIFNSVLQKNTLANHELRSNSERVRSRFSVYQVLEGLPSRQAREVLSVMSGRSHDISEATWEVIKGCEFYLFDKKWAKFESAGDFLKFVDLLSTKKQTQRALCASEPAPAALSIPDDACHYDKENLRTLTVREMARIQSFPDDFVFRSKVTTGGQMRSFEVPQYTQVGNAVPPLLGRALGVALKEIIQRVDGL
jgi:DNA (cytosine-5)-methyltransferase 1